MSSLPPDKEKKLMAVMAEVLGQRYWVLCLVFDRENPKSTCDVITCPASAEELKLVRSLLVRMQIPSEAPHNS